MNEDQLLADQPLGQKLIKKGFWLYFFMIITAPVGYLIKVLISNTLSVEDIGIFYSVLGLIVLISTYNDLGLTEALQYFLPKYRLNKEYNNYKTILYLTIIVQFITGIGIALGLYFSAERLAIHHFQSTTAIPIIKTLCRYFVGINFLQAFQSVFLAFQDVSANNITTTSNLYTTLIFTVIFRLSQSLDVFSFSYAWIFGVAMGVISSILLFIRKYKKTLNKGTFSPNKSLIKTQLLYAFWVFLGANIGTLLGQVDLQLVINLLGATEAGYYTNFYTLFGSYIIIITPILGFLFPIVTEIQTKKDNQKLELLQNIFYKYFSIFALSIAGIFIAFGPHIASILFGSKFLYSGQLLQYIGPGLLFNVLIIINFNILAGLGKVKERVKILFTGLIVNISINLIGIIIFKIGLISVVLGLIGGWIVLMRRSYILINRNCPIAFDWIFFLKNLIIIGSLTLLSSLLIAPKFILENNLRYTNLLRLIVFMIIYYIIIGLINLNSIKILIKEIKTIKKN